MPNDTKLNTDPYSSAYQDISQKSFDKLNDEQKNIILNGNNSIHEKEKDSGLIGKFLGSNPKNASIHFSFVICVISLLICLADLIHSFRTSQMITSEVWNFLVPIVSMSIGYIFGKEKN